MILEYGEVRTSAESERVLSCHLQENNVVYAGVQVGSFSDINLKLIATGLRSVIGSSH